MTEECVEADEERVEADKVVGGLTTKADKIRALAKAGYRRTEIRDFLGIRYQHVRNVLLRSGIEGGLQPGRGNNRSVVPPQPMRNQPEPISCQVLLRAGFEYSGEWELVDGELNLKANIPSESGVYAFVVDDFIVYIGLTQTGLRTRMSHYRRGHARQRTSARVKKLIVETLQGGQRVKILTAMPEPLIWNDLPVDTAAGLEAGLIREFRPAWNIQGAS